MLAHLSLIEDGEELLFSGLGGEEPPTESGYPSYDLKSPARSAPVLNRLFED
jgi:hypothetical protein